MNYYFQLQFKRFQRVLSEAGIQPLIGVVLTLAGYFFGAFYIGFNHPEGNQILLVMGILIQLSALQKQNSEFLELHFSKVITKTLRFIELVIVTLPPTLVLFASGKLLWGFGLIFSALILIQTSKNSLGSFTIPTPFKNYPFELPAGFRVNALYGILLYGGIFVSFYTNNPNLGLVAFGLLQLIVLSSFMKVEDEFFVWVYDLNPRKFLFQKIGYFMLGSITLSLPAAILLVFSLKGLSINLFYIYLGFTYLFTLVLLMKYSNYPKELSVPQAIIIGFCILMPFLGLFFIPFYFSRATKNLMLLLNDKD